MKQLRELVLPPPPRAKVDDCCPQFMPSPLCAEAYPMSVFFLFPDSMGG